MSNNNEIENKFYEENKKSSKYYLLFIEYNPYAPNIKITVDGKEIESSSSLHPLDYTFEEWIDKLPLNLSEEYEDCENIKIGFHGTNSDKEALIKVFDKSEVKIIDFINYPILNFNDKLKIVEQIYSEINSGKKIFSEIINLLNNFRRDLDNNENLKDTVKYGLIEDLSNKLKDNIKSCYGREDDFIKKEKNKIDISIGSIRKNITSLREKLGKTKEIKNKVESYIQEFQNKFPESSKEIKDKYLNEFQSEIQDYLGSKKPNNNDDICAEIIYAKKAERGNKEHYTFNPNFCNNERKNFKTFVWPPTIISSEKFQSFVYDLQVEFRKDIKTIVDDEFSKWKENLNDLQFIFDNKDNLLKSFLQAFVDCLGGRYLINFDSMKNFDDVKNKLEENFSYIIDKEEQHIEKQKEKIGKSFSNLCFNIKEEIKEKEEEIKEKEEEKRNIQSPNIELLQEIEKQVDSLVAI